MILYYSFTIKNKIGYRYKQLSVEYMILFLEENYEIINDFSKFKKRKIQLNRLFFIKKFWKKC